MSPSTGGGDQHMRLDRATREREYSPSSIIGGDYAPYIERYRLASAEAHRMVPVQRDLRHGDSPRALIDYFAAPAPGNGPGLLVYFHGGYWQELSKAESAFLAPAWHAAGLAHAVVGYTLAPAARLPDIVDECRAAVRWLHARAGTLGSTPTRSSSPAAPPAPIWQRPAAMPCRRPCAASSPSPASTTSRR